MPDTGHLRTSILAAWADHLAGLLTFEAIAPRVPATVELDVHLYRPAPGTGTLEGSGVSLKSGRSVFVATVDFSTGLGQPVGFASASFMAAPDETLRLPARTSLDQLIPNDRRLEVPFAERAGCRRQDSGVAVLEHSDEALNASNTLNGGLIALAAEEAAVSISPGATLASLALRFLQPVRVGPAVARARMHGGLGRVEVRDAGRDQRLCVVATCRSFDAAATPSS